MKSAFLRAARTHRAISVVLAAYILLGITYSLVDPLFEASDELWHYPFVKHLADGHGLPVQQPGVEQPWRQEGSQPPLYYALGALATCWIDTDDLDEILWRNPHADMGIPKPDRNANMVIHTAREGWPWRGAALAVRIVRWLSVLLGACAVLLTYAIALELCPGDRALAAGAAAFVAFNPMFLFISSSVNNDNLATALSSLALWLLLRLTKGVDRLRDLAWLGVTLGLAALAKSSALGLLALAGPALAYAAYRRRSWAALIRGGAVVYGLVVLIAGWWFVRNWRLYGDPSGLNTFVAIVGARYPVPTLRQLWGERVGFTMSFWGFFGGMNVPMSGWLYRLLDIAAGVGGLGLLTGLARWWRGWAWDERARWLLVAAAPAIVFVSLIRWTLMTIATQGRLMFSAISAIAVLLVWGWLALVPRRGRAVAAVVIAVAFLVLGLVAPGAYIAPAYARPPLLTEADLPAGIQRLGIVFGERMELVGYAMPDQEAHPGEDAPITLYWRARAPMAQDYSVFVHLLSGDDLIIGQRDMYPGQGTFPTTLWQPGDMVADTYVVPILPATLTPATATVEVGLYLLETGERLPARDSQGQPMGDNARFGELAIQPRQGDVPNPVMFNLDDRIALVGYELDRTSARPGEAFHLTLYWRALRDIDANYAVFTQVVGENHEIWAQKDAWPQDGLAPTATWRKGQLIRDPYELVVRPEAPAGVWDLQVGMYAAEGEPKRLNLLGEGGHAQDNRILLGKVRIVRP
ncbi:MAG: DUF2142 domain-containing protein [Chloroflexi bacterium]|nr:DUF2142 domain-containing protein [Chloroflexota bacterium]